MSNCLLEASPNRKIKISLSDYNYQKDIENRLLMADLTEEERMILEEILFSSLRFPTTKLAKALEMDVDTLAKKLEKLSKSGLFVLDKGEILVDKEMRKYFELQMQKFDEDFEPGMEFIQSLLKKPPIHVLPTWYSISRTSDSIFDSIIEKNLATPQLFQRYVAELNLGEPILKQIIQDVYNAEDFELSSSFLMKKYNITRALFEEYMLHLEFSFVCCIGYRKNGDIWEEKVTPFHEWRTYLRFLKDKEVAPLPNPEDVVPKRPNGFSFVEDLSTLLEKAKKNLQPRELGLLLEESYLKRLIDKALLLHLVEKEGESLSITEAGAEWLELSLDRKALYLYKHPLNRIVDSRIPEELITEKAMREAEKAIVGALNKGWVLFDQFFEGVIASLNEESTVMLKRQGRAWRYAIPKYTDTEAHFLRSVILDWLFEAGIVQVGTIAEEDCFRVTPFGHSLFAR